MGGTYSLPATLNFQMTGIRWFTAAGYRKNQEKWDAADLAVDMKGKVCIVTGANSGLGYEVTSELAKRNARVYMLCRSEEKGRQALEKIQRKFPLANLKLAIVDISRPQQIREFAKEYVETEDRLDVLVNNAGVLLNERKETPEGLEMTFATHTLGSFLMTEYLREILKKSAPSRVIIVTSGGMYTQKLDVDDLQFKDKKYNGTTAYAQQKRALMDLTLMWHDKYSEEDITFNAVHPGWTRTPGTQSSLPKWFDKLDLRNPSKEPILSCGLPCVTK